MNRIAAKLIIFFICGLFLFLSPISLGQSPTGEVSENLAGQFLVAPREMQDPRFEEAVIYLVENNERDGSFGFIINKPAGDHPLSEVFRGFERFEEVEEEITVYFGGPVEPQKATILHTPEVSMSDDQVAGLNLMMTGDPQILLRVLEGEGPESYIFLLGYAGWSPGQLEREIRMGSWLVVDATEEQIFSSEPESLWEEIIGAHVFTL